LKRKRISFTLEWPESYRGTQDLIIISKLLFTSVLDELEGFGMAGEFDMEISNSIHARIYLERFQNKIGFIHSTQEWYFMDLCFCLNEWLFRT